MENMSLSDIVAVTRGNDDCMAEVKVLVDSYK